MGDILCHMLQLSPECCGSREELEREKEEIYVLEIDGELVGSVAIYDNEIDDLVVKKDFQGIGYGEALLRYAVSCLQSKNNSPIVLHVADWIQGPAGMYLKNGFDEPPVAGTPRFLCMVVWPVTREF